jgi:hypothetical protein
MVVRVYRRDKDELMRIRDKKNESAGVGANYTMTMLVKEELRKLLKENGLPTI